MKIPNISKNYFIKTYNILDLELENLWRNFEKNSFNSVFHKFEWVKNWYEICAENRLNIKILIIVIYKNNKIEAILPFIINYFLGLNILRWTGYPFSDLNTGLFNKDFLINKYDFTQIWNFIIKNNNIDAVDLINCPSKIIEIDNPLISNLKCKTNLISYKILNQKDFNKYCLIREINNKTSFFQDIKRLKKKGRLLFKVLDNNNYIEKNQAVQFLLKNKKDQLLRTSAWNYLDKDYYINFLNKIFTLNFSKFYALYLDDTILSIVMGYEDKDNKIFYYILPTYAIEFKKFSVGKINLFYLVKLLIEKNFSLDFTIGNEKYKIKWSTDNQKIYYFCQFYTFKGIFYILYKILYRIFSKSFFKKFFFKKIYHYFKI